MSYQAAVRGFPVRPSTGGPGSWKRAGEGAYGKPIMWVKLSLYIAGSIGAELLAMQGVRVQSLVKLTAFWQSCAKILLKYLVFFKYIFSSCSHVASNRDVAVLATAYDCKGGMAVSPRIRQCVRPSVRLCPYALLTRKSKGIS